MDITHYPNGFRCIHQKPTLAHSKTSYIHCFINLGSVFEQDGYRGASHYIEHMVFKGTKKYPSSLAITSVFDQQGAYINAYTEKRYTCYTIQCNSDAVPICLNMLSQMMFHSIFPNKELVKENEVVIEENSKDEDDPENILFESLDREIFAGSPYSFPVDSMKYHEPPNSRHFDYKKIIELYHQYYVPSNMVLSIVSSAPWTQIERTLRTTDFIRNGKNNNPIRNPNTIVSTISPTLIRNDYSIVKSAKTSNALKHNNTNNIWIHKREISTAHLGISFRIGGMYTRERFQWIVLNQILSGTLSARLFTILREENGLTYTSNTEIKFYESVGSFTIYAETEKSKLFKNGKKPGVLPLCVKFVEDLYRDGITEEELRRAQGYLAGTHIQDAEDGEEIVEYNGFREMFEMKDKSEYPMVEYKDFYKVYLEPVTKKEVDDLIKKWLEPSKMVLRIVSENI